MDWIKRQLVLGHYLVIRRLALHRKLYLIILSITMITAVILSCVSGVSVAFAATPLEPGAVAKPDGWVIRLPWNLEGEIKVSKGYGPVDDPNYNTHIRTDSIDHPNDYYAIDFDLPKGTPVLAVASGTVKFAGWTSDGWSKYGQVVLIEHNVGGVMYQSLYAHLSEIRVSVGKPVTQSEVIGLSGASGDNQNQNYWSPHLHFAFYQEAKYDNRGVWGGKAVVPEPFTGIKEYSDIKTGDYLTSSVPAPPEKWTVNLSASSTSATVNQTVTLTATANSDVSTVKGRIVIRDQTMFNNYVSEKASGTVTSYSVTSTSTTTHTFIAAVEDSSGNILASSITISVTWGSATQNWTVNLSASSTNPSANQSVALTATTNRDVGPTAYGLYIVDTSTGQQQNFPTGSSGTWTVSPYPGQTHIFVARIGLFAGSDTQVETFPVTVTWGSATQNWTVNLSASSTNPSANQSVALTATTNRDVGPTAYGLYIVDTSTGQQQNFPTGSSGTWTVSPYPGQTHIFVARIGLFAGSDTQVETFPVTVTWAGATNVSPQPGSGIALYDGANYGDPVIVLTVGKYSNLSDYSWYDRIESIRFLGDYQNNYHVVLYSEKDFTGDPGHYDFDSPTLGNAQRNHVRSVEIYKKSPGSGIILYDGENYSGNSQFFAVGYPEGKYADLSTVGFWDRAESIQFVGDLAGGMGHTVLYSEKDFSGDPGHYDFDSPTLGNAQRNHVRSVAVYKHQPPGPPTNPTPANGRVLDVVSDSLDITFDGSGDQFQIHVWGNNYDRWRNWDTPKGMHLDGLIPGQTYHWQAQGKSRIGLSPWSPEWSFTTGSSSAVKPSPDNLAGTKIAFVSNRDGPWNIYVMNPDGTNLTRLTTAVANNSDPDWSPDGSKIAFWSDRDGNYEIYVMNADGSDQKRLTERPGFDFNPAWSPDGSKIAFVSDWAICVMNSDGSNQVQLTSTGLNGSPAWSPDGKKIAYNSGLDDDGTIWVMNSDGSNQIRITDKINWDADWSPDGKKIAFTSKRDGNQGIFIMNSDGTNHTRITNLIRSGSSSWSPDDTKLVFNDGDPWKNQIYVINSDGSDKINLTNNSFDNFCPAWSPFKSNIFTVPSGSSTAALTPTAITNIKIGEGAIGPISVSINATTNRIYVTNNKSNNVSVIDGDSNVQIALIGVGAAPDGIALNSITNRIYVANTKSNNLSVIDGLNNTVVATLSTGREPSGVSVNPKTNRIYVSNFNDDTVSVIDGVNNSIIATVKVGPALPYGIIVNPITNRIYVANEKSGVSVIDGFTNAIVATLKLGVAPYRMALNLETNCIYVTNQSNGPVVVINGVNNTKAAEINAGSYPLGVAVNSNTNRTYITNGGNAVSVIDGTTYTVASTVRVGSRLGGIAVNPSTGQIFVANYDSNTLSVFKEGSTSSLPMLTARKAIPTDVLGSHSALQIGDDGKTQDTFNLMSSDGKLSISLPAKTQILDSAGKPATGIYTVVKENPPTLPSTSRMIGLAYEFGPPGTTFNPPLSLSYHYTHDQIPTGVNEADICLALYDENTQKWIPVNGTLDTDVNLITANISHFSTYAVIGALASESSQAKSAINPSATPPNTPAPKTALTPTSTEKLTQAQPATPAAPISGITNMFTTVWSKVTGFFQSFSIPLGLIGEIFGGLIIVILIIALVINKRAK
jgi:YVTN family beta-propeller protein